MNKLVYICFGILFMNVPAIFGQSPSDSITVLNKLGPVFIQKGNYLTPKQLLEITKSYPDAHQEMKTAKSNYDMSVILGFAGGFLVGYPLGTAIAGGEPNWTLAGIGAGVIVLSLPFSISYAQHAKKAVALFNSSLPETGSENVSYGLGFTPDGIGLVMRF